MADSLEIESRTLHELSIAQNIVEIVKQSVPADELINVSKVRLRIGEMSGVVTDSLEFGFQAITSDTELKNAKLEIERIPFVFKCNNCMNTSTNNYGITICAVCGNSDTEIVSGLEIQIVEVELKDIFAEV